MDTNYTRIRALWADHLGLARGKYLPREHAEHGTFHCLSTFALGYDRDMTPAPGTKMLEGLPDMRATFRPSDIRPGWEPGTGVVVADLSYEGQPLPISSRRVLQQAVADWETLGYHPKVGLELEAYVFEPDGQGGWKPWDTPGAFVYGTGMAVDPVGLLDDIMETARASGLPIESINSEYDTPQFELTLHYDDALKACDDMFLFKLMAREVAHRHGLLLTYLGKPLGDRGGSGLHVNLSAWKDDGTNAFYDPSADDGLSEVAYQSIAGLMEHHEAMAALCAPTVNAYKRLQPGAMCGYWANWAHDHRGVTCRISPDRGPGTRIEHRMSDGAANPYTATAAVLQAARLGVVDGPDLPSEETADCLESSDSERTVPPTLDAALDALEADEKLIQAIGRDFVEHFVVIKRAEWQRFITAVTDWELNEYLPFH
jgi:glutamine synthetase